MAGQTSNGNHNTNRAAAAGRVFVVFAVLLAVLLVMPTGIAQAADPSNALLSKYCYSCHNERLKTAGLMLDKLDVANIPANSETWEKVARKLRTGMMPPSGLPRPERLAADALAGQIETALDRAATANPNPGRTEALHRLNRNEYRNVVRDLLDLEIDVASLLPADDASYGFDNIAGILRVSPALMERYTSAARKISRVAVGARSIPATDDTFRLPSDLSQEDHIEGLPLGTRGGISIPYTFPLDADYEFRVKLAAEYQGLVRPAAEPHQIEISIDGQRVQLFTIGDDPSKRDADANLRVRLFVKAGPHQVATAFLKKSSALAESLRSSFLRPSIGAGGDTRLQPYIGSVTINGPFDAKGPGDTPSRGRIFVCRPTGKMDPEPCARKMLSTLARRAYRRPVTEADLGILMRFYRDGVADGGFESGVELALRRLLVSPTFLFRIERDPPGAVPATPYRIGDIELASRLSFFLWSSIPDDELLDQAVRGRLKDPAVLERQVRRMLDDTRSQALVRNFTGQWLYLRNLPDKTPDSELFPDFDDGLRQAFGREAELLFGSFLHGNASAVEMLTANYTFLNERLARHYGIPNVYGNRFRKVPLTNPARGGLLGLGSILLVTSNPNRTSPVVRGKWLLENLLGTPPPPPPPNVPSLKENNEIDRPLSVRERLEAHRANPACASCHKLMDPLGFAMENFDAVGQWRTVSEAGTPIDSSGVLVDGTAVDGPAALKRALVSRPDSFVITLTEKLLTYALGRGLEYYDAPAVRKVTRDAGGGNASLPSLIMNIVRSAPFQMRRSQS